MKLTISNQLLAGCFISLAYFLPVPVVAAAKETSIVKIDSKVGDDAIAAETADRRKLSPTTMIIGGDQAEKGEFPYYGESSIYLKLQSVPLR